MNEKSIQAQIKARKELCNAVNDLGEQLAEFGVEINAKFLEDYTSEGRTAIEKIAISQAKSKLPEGVEILFAQVEAATRMKVGRINFGRMQTIFERATLGARIECFSSFVRERKGCFYIGG